MMYRAIGPGPPPAASRPAAPAGPILLAVDRQLPNSRVLGSRSW